jgi:hypothetical protein
MPINRLFREGKFKPEEVERLNRAFIFTLHHLDLVDRNDPVCEIVARKVMDIDAAGIHDPEEIANSQGNSLVFRMLVGSSDSSAPAGVNRRSRFRA